MNLPLVTRALMAAVLMMQWPYLPQFLIPPPLLAQTHKADARLQSKFTALTKHDMHGSRLTH